VRSPERPPDLNVEGLDESMDGEDSAAVGRGDDEGDDDSVMGDDDAAAALEAVSSARGLSSQPVNRFGFVVVDLSAPGAPSAESAASAAPTPVTRAEARRENGRAEKWRVMLSRWGEFTRRRPRVIKSRVRKGIPDSLRGIVWPVLVGGDELARRHPGRYRRLLLAAPREDDFGIIMRDLDRTFPRHLQFREPGGAGQLALMRLLRAYAAYDRDVGYCQGMAFVAALLLTYMPEEAAFWTFVALMRRRGLRAHYLPQLPLFMEHEAVLGGLMERHEPALRADLEAKGVVLTMFGAQWFLTLFAHSFPFDVVVRVLDVVCLEGHKALLRCVLAVLRLLRPRVLGLPFDQMVSRLGVPPLDLTADDIIDTALRIRVTSDDVMRLRSAFRGSAAGRRLRRACGQNIARRRAAAASRGREAAQAAHSAGRPDVAAAWAEAAAAFGEDDGVDDPEAVYWSDSAAQWAASEGAASLSEGAKAAPPLPDPALEAGSAAAPPCDAPPPSPVMMSPWIPVAEDAVTPVVADWAPRRSHRRSDSNTSTATSSSAAGRQGRTGRDATGAASRVGNVGPAARHARAATALNPPAARPAMASVPPSPAASVAVSTPAAAHYAFPLPGSAGRAERILLSPSRLPAGAAAPQPRRRSRLAPRSPGAATAASVASAASSYRTAIGSSSSLAGGRILGPEVVSVPHARRGRGSGFAPPSSLPRRPSLGFDDALSSSYASSGAGDGSAPGLPRSPPLGSRDEADAGRQGPPRAGAGVGVGAGAGGRRHSVPSARAPGRALAALSGSEDGDEARRRGGDGDDGVGSDGGEEEEEEEEAGGWDGGAAPEHRALPLAMPHGRRSTEGSPEPADARRRRREERGRAREEAGRATAAAASAIWRTEGRRQAGLAAALQGGEGPRGSGVLAGGEGQRQGGVVDGEGAAASGGASAGPGGADSVRSGLTGVTGVTTSTAATTISGMGDRCRAASGTVGRGSRSSLSLGGPVEAGGASSPVAVAVTVSGGRRSSEDGAAVPSHAGARGPSLLLVDAGRGASGSGCESPGGGDGFLASAVGGAAAGSGGDAEAMWAGLCAAGDAADDAARERQRQRRDGIARGWGGDGDDDDDAMEEGGGDVTEAAGSGGRAPAAMYSRLGRSSMTPPQEPQQAGARARPRGGSELGPGQLAARRGRDSRATSDCDGATTTTTGSVGPMSLRALPLSADGFSSGADGRLAGTWVLPRGRQPRRPASTSRSTTPVSPRDGDGADAAPLQMRGAVPRGRAVPSMRAAAT